ncbi:hypothetical protein SO802_017857 [Lithocarpus litseifolius]|uniref:Zinc finger GRF-type domain-containing protein n=1 Tax=Lithocarpus litseifolius TaxID=425828 RepID=A0AAW2CNH5_9ROSI
MEGSSSTSSSVRRRAPMMCYWRKCRFFQWCDDEICERGKVLIPQQRQRIIKIEAELAECKKREKF